jgi:hypothetical protein
MRFAGSIEQREVTLYHGRHRLTIPLPERDAAIDDGEEEGEGATWEVRRGKLMRAS